jgi:molecular chaperone GrpE
MNPEEKSTEKSTTEEQLVAQAEEASATEVELQESEAKVEDAFAKMQEELGLIHDRYLRLGAEFENFKKRSERERLSAIRFANENLLVEILPVLDNLEHALAAANSHAEGNNVVTGVQMVLKQFRDILAKAGLSAFDSLGTAFDPNLHEALAERESDEHDAGVVVEEYQKGYKLNDRLVRPARVVVSKKKAS